MKNSINLITLITSIFVFILIFGVQTSDHDINKIPKLIGSGQFAVSEDFQFFINDQEVKDDSHQKLGLIINDLKELKQSFNYKYNKESNTYDLTLHYHLFMLNSNITLADDMVILNNGKIKLNRKEYCQN